VQISVQKRFQKDRASVFVNYKNKNPCKRLIYRDKIHFSFSICGAGGNVILPNSY
jgi:hypothetical protein